MPTKTYILNPAEQKKLHYLYHDFQKETTSQYMKYHYKVHKTTLSLYTSGKLVVQGSDITEEVRVLDGLFQEASKKTSSTQKPLSNEEITSSSFQKNELKNADLIGSDEVGVGDYFGGICVAAALVQKKDIPKLQQIGITDSKKISDERILELAKEIAYLPHTVHTLAPKEYNAYIAKGFNMAELKALLHNEVLKRLARLCDEQHTPYDGFMVDQFLPKKNYMNYLHKRNIESTPIERTYMETKAESSYLSVACASILARAAFLYHIQALETTYKLPKIPLGAGAHVDAYARSLYQNFSETLLDEITKNHFKNRSRVLPSTL